MGDAVLPQVLFRQRHWRRHSDRAVLAAAFWVRATAAPVNRDRRLRRGLRAAAGIRTLFSGPADLHVLRLSDSGPDLRADHGRDRVLLVAVGCRRRRQRDASRRPGRRIRVSEERRCQPPGRAQVPILEVEDQSGPQEVRRLLGWPGRRLGPTRTLRTRSW